MPKKVVSDIVKPTTKRKSSASHLSHSRTIHHKHHKKEELEMSAGNQTMADVPEEQDVYRNEAYRHITQTGPSKNFWSNFDNPRGASSKPGRPPFVVPPSNDSSSKFALWVIAGISVIILVFALSTLFTGAKVTLTPKKAQFTLAETEFTAIKGASVTGIGFDIMTLTESESKNVTSTKTEMVERRAEGKIVVYNNFGKESQKLIEKTRFESPDGKIYRINEAVTVPGMSVKDGENVPGSIEVTVYADQPGSEYNIEPTDFTIPGFKDSPRFDKFYARSTGPISGGAKGLEPVVDQDEADKVKNLLGESLKAKLLAKAISETPNGFILFNDANFIEITSQIGQNSPDSKDVPVKVNGKLTGIIIDRNSLSSNILKKTSVAIGEDDSVSIPSLNQFSFTLQNKANINTSDLSEIKFLLSGSGSAVWNIDIAKLAEDLAGKSKKLLPDVVAMYSGIERADASVKPFWKNTFPGRKDEINISIVD